MPTLKECAPEILKLVKAFGDIATWALQNPWTAVVAALGASLLRAGIESVIRAGIERAIKAGAERFGLMGGPMLGEATVPAVVTTGIALDQLRRLKKTMGDTGFSALGRDALQLLPGVDKKGKFNSDKLIESAVDFSPIAMLLHPSGAIARLRDIGGTLLKVKDDLSFSRTDENMNLDARSRAKAEAVKRATEMAKDESLFKQPEEKNNFQRVVGKPGETVEQLRQRILATNTERQTAFRQQQLQEKMATDIAALKTATLKVEVQNFPGAPTDHPKAPPPEHA